MICSLQAKDGRYWHGPEKDTGITWGAGVEAWLFADEKAARKVLEGLSCPSAADASIVQPPVAALVGGEAADAIDGELEETPPTRPGRRVKLRRPRSTR